MRWRYLDKFFLRYLDQDVEADVKVSTVNKLVCEKSPNLLFLCWIEDQRSLPRENCQTLEDAKKRRFVFFKSSSEV